MQMISVQPATPCVLAKIAFMQPRLNEGQLLRLFFKAAHKDQEGLSQYDSWLQETQKQLTSLKKNSYQKSNYCPTLSIRLKNRISMYIQVIKRFELQFQMGCPSAKKGAGNILKQLKSIEATSQLILLYMTV